MLSESLMLFGLSESALRLSIFAVAFILFSGLEALFPRRKRRLRRGTRWLTNGAMLVIATLFGRALALALPLLAAIVAADYAAQLGLGLFNLIDLPLWLEVTLAMILLDLAIWFQHLISHKIPLLWRIHRVHHADHDLDATSALRFHPVEMLLSSAYKLVIILILGPAIVAVILFEIVLNASAMFNHANLAMPRWLDTVLRTLLVTPDMHRVHHSVRPEEHNHNYGFCLSIWDRMFYTYTAEPSDGHIDMTIGLASYQDDPTENLVWSLNLPLRR